MYTEYTYKEQGDGSAEFPLKDSWTISDYVDNTKDVLLDRRMVYVDPTDPILIEKAKYEQRKVDGVEVYLMLMAEFRVMNQPRSVNRNLENKLEVVRNEITNGQWISAGEKMATINVSQDLTQEIHDRLTLSISTYIDNNY